MKKWKNYAFDSINEVHCVPEDDALEHLVEDCPCLPTTEAIEREDGTYARFVIHNAWDGRK